MYILVEVHKCNLKSAVLARMKIAYLRCRRVVFFGQVKGLDQGWVKRIIDDEVSLPDDVSKICAS